MERTGAAAGGTAAQIVVVSASKLIAGSELYKVNRVGVYSEAAATLAYAAAAALLIADWCRPAAGAAITPADRGRTITEWLGIYGATYVVVLFALLPLLVQRSHFDHGVVDLMFACYGPLIGAAAVGAVLAFTVPWSVVVVPVVGTMAASLGWFVGYAVTWCARHPLNWITKHNPRRWLTRFTAWLDARPA